MATLATIVVGVFVKSAKTLAAIRQVSNFAYDAVNLAKGQTSTQIDDKAALALKVITERLGRELSPAEVVTAKAVFEARHAEEIVAKEMIKKLGVK